MGKLFFFFLFSSFILNVSLQAKERRGRKSNISEVAFHGAKSRTFTGSELVKPRTFIGEIKTKSFTLSNGTKTQAPCSSPSTPPSPSELRLLSNSTAEYLSGRLSTRVIPSIYLLVIAVGIPANIAILFALATKLRRVSSSILYSSLASSDLLLLLSLIFKADYHLRGNHWMFGENACRVVTACFYGNLCCSAQTLACISVMRYLAVAQPFLYKSLPKKSCSAWAALVVWVVFGAAVVPELLVQQCYRLQLGITTCHDVLPVDSYTSHAPLLYYKLGLTFLGLLLPLVVTAVCFVRIVYELNRSHQDWALYVKASSLVFVIFLLCFGPAGTLHFLHYVLLFAGREEHFYAYFNVAVCLCCLHSCLDPFLFLLMSRSAGPKVHFMTLKGKTSSIS